jgi:hypothetical protein
MKRASSNSDTPAARGTRSAVAQDCCLDERSVTPWAPPSSGWSASLWAASSPGWCTPSRRGVASEPNCERRFGFCTWSFLERNRSSRRLAHDDAGRLKGAISIDRWSQFSGLIAKKADETRWRDLAAAYGNLAVLRADAEFMQPRKLLPNEREAIAEFLALVNTAEQALRNEALAGQLP